MARAPASGGCGACSRRASIPVTVFGVATALARNPQIVAAMREAGWDIASHGLKWIDYKDFSRRARKAPICARRSASIPRRPASGRWAGTPAAHPRTRLKLVLEDGGFLYSSDSYADDLPYWVKGPKGPHLIIPYSLDANDMRFINPQGFPDGEAFFTYLRDTFDYLYAEGARRAEDDVGRPALPVGRAARPRRRAGPVSRSHRQIRSGLGRRRASILRGIGTASISRSRPMRRLIGLKARIAMAQITLDELNRMDRRALSAALGDVFEHSPWIAEAAFAARPFPSCECAL